MTIRRQPADFRVEELLSEAARLAIKPCGEAKGPVIYRLTKTGKTTPEAVHLLAKAVGARGGMVGYGGLKDKHAQTSQYVSIPSEAMRSSAAPPPDIGGHGWNAHLVGAASEELSAESIRGNLFTIVVRGLTREAGAEMDRRAQLLLDSSAAEPRLVVMNYFGAQRFGSARHGQGFIAKHLIRGEFEQALKLAIATPARKDTGRTRHFTRLAAGQWGQWAALARELPACPERRPIEALAGGADFRSAFSTLPPMLQFLYVEAYQSHLWNATARRLAPKISPHPLSTPDEFGEMLFPLAQDAQPTWWVDMPVVAKTTQLVPPWGEDAAAVLAEEGVELSGLKIPGLRRPYFGEASRPLLIAAERFAMSPGEPDELASPRSPANLKRTVSFELVRGGYATVVLRALGQ